MRAAETARTPIPTTQTTPRPAELRRLAERLGPVPAVPAVKVVQLIPGACRVPVGTPAEVERPVKVERLVEVGRPAKVALGEIQAELETRVAVEAAE